MFSYIDPSIKELLIERGQLIGIDEHGKPCEGAARQFISIVGPIPLPITLDEGPVTFKWYAWVRHSDLSRIESVVDEVRANGPKMLFGLITNYMSVNAALVLGQFSEAEAPIVRVHSNCLTGDAFGSMRCDCGPQLRAALEQIHFEGTGALIYMASHEGRGIGLWAKAITYLLQDAGHDTYEANEKLGLPTDSRDFSDAGRVLSYLRGGPKAIRLLGNNLLKRKGVEELGIKVVEQEPLVVGVNPYNVRYLGSKREHGHLIPHEALSDTPIRPTTSSPALAGRDNDSK